MTQHPTDPGLIAQGGSETAGTDILTEAQAALTATKCTDAMHDLFRVGLVRELRDALYRLHSWDGLMALLDEHWPQSIFPTTLDRPDRDPGPRIVSLVRWVDSLRAQVELQTAEVERLRGALDGLATELQAHVHTTPSDDDHEIICDVESTIAHRIRDVLRGED